MITNVRIWKDAIFPDIDSIPAAVDYREHINSVIAESALLLVIMGQRWLGSSSAGTARLDDEIGHGPLSRDGLIPAMPSISILPKNLKLSHF